MPFMADKVPVNNTQDTLPHTTTSNYTKFSETKATFTKSGYGLFLSIVDIIPDIKNEKSIGDVWIYLIFICFAIPLFLILFILVYCWKINFKNLFRLNSALFICSSIPIILYVISGNIENINQIKFGYYLFLSVIALLIVFSRKTYLQNMKR